MLTDQNKYFLQFMISRSCASLKEVLKYMKTLKIEDQQLDEAFIATIAAEINNEIAAQKFEICFKHCEVTGSKNVVFINTVTDDASKAQIKYSPLNMEYFQSIIKDIISSNKRCLSMIGCMNLTSTLTKKLTRIQAEEYIKSWIKYGYLYDDDNHVYLGSKFLSEYMNYMEATCKDYMSVCSLCAEALFVGKVCTTCNIAFHKHCLMKKSNNQLTQCPQCKAEDVVDNIEHDITEHHNDSEEQEEMDTNIDCTENEGQSD